MDSRLENGSYERSILKKFQRIICIDEVGRGAWAGPLLIGLAFVTAKNISLLQALTSVKDSKLLNKKSRENLKLELDAISEYYPSFITMEISVDSINRQGLAGAYRGIIGQVVKDYGNSSTFFLVDGSIPIMSYTSNSEVIVKGDSKVRGIALAANFAKVTRDQQMANLENEYPMFSFSKHVGYGTRQHQIELKNYGVTPEHRLLFKPVADSLLLS